MTKELITVGLAMLPIAELEAAIPYGIISGIAPLTAYALAVAGNLLALLPVLLLWRAVLRYAKQKTEHTPGFLAGFFQWLFSKTQHHKSRYMQVTGLVSLGFFVALPLPYTGIYTGSLIAALFDFPLWKSVCAIVLGVLADGVAVLALTVGIRSIF